MAADKGALTIHMDIPGDLSELYKVSAEDIATACAFDPEFGRNGIKWSNLKETYERRTGLYLGKDPNELPKGNICKTVKALRELADRLEAGEYVGGPGED